MCVARCESSNLYGLIASPVAYRLQGSKELQMRNNTKDTTDAVIRGASCGIIACVVAVVFVFASGDSATTNGAHEASIASTTEVAGVLLSPRTRLIIDYKRSALA
jgi:hypothetical protein